MPSQAIRWCTATPDQPHPATRKTGRCDFHQAEHDRAMSAYRSALHSHSKGIGRHPGDKAAYEAAITYTTLDHVYTVLSGPDRSRMRTQAAADSAATAFLARLATNPRALYDLDPGEFSAQLAEFLRVHAATLDLLHDLGDEPQH